MKTIMNKKLIIIIALFLLLCLTACNDSSPEQEIAENETTAEQETEESRIMMEQDETENEKETEPVNGEGEEREESTGMTEREQEYTYRGDAVLTKENFETTMKSLLYTQRKSSLEELPLTEEFFNECMEKFPYIEGVRMGLINEFEVEFWGIREDGRWVCLCEFDRGHEWDRKSKCDYYYIVMDVENDQIASMEITLVEKYVKE